MRKHTARWLVLALLVVGALAAAAPAAADASHEARSISLVNALRRQVGVAPLTVDSRLTTMARRWAGVMAGRGSISHNPNLHSEAPSDWTSIGENVGFGSSVDEIQSLWENSSMHYRNMVEGSFTNIGAGFVESGGYLWGVLVFTGGGALGAAAPEAAPASAAPEPAAAEAVATEAAPTEAAPGYDTDAYETSGFYEEEDVDNTPNPALADDPATGSDEDAQQGLRGGFSGFGSGFGSGFSPGLAGQPGQASPA